MSLTARGVALVQGLLFALSLVACTPEPSQPGPRGAMSGDSTKSDARSSRSAVPTSSAVGNESSAALERSVSAPEPFVSGGAAASAEPAASGQPATTTPAVAVLTAESPLEAGCKPAAPGDHYWDYPDRLNASGVLLKQSPATSLRGYLFWTSDTEACLRVDLRTISTDQFANHGVEGELHLELRLAFDFSLQPISPVSHFRFEAVEPDRVYSVSLRVRCEDKSRKDCRSVNVFVAHPRPGPGFLSVGIGLRDG